MQNQSVPVRRFLRIRAVRERTGLSRSTVHKLELAGDFPKRVVLGPRSVGWWEDEVTGWMDSRRRAGE